MKSFYCVSVLAASLISNQGIAGTMGPIEPVKDWGWMAAISAGPTWARGGDTQSFFLAPEIEKTYAAQKSTNALASGELFLGMQQSLSSQWLGALGLAVATTGNAKMQGAIWDDADVEFNNYRYQYKVSNTRIALKGKLFLDNQNRFAVMPWVSASAGVGFNRAHGFTNTPVIFEAVPNANFSNHTKTAFTYTLGAGVQKSINANWQIGVGYEFADWGKSSLGRASGQTLNSGLALKHLYTNGVMFNLTYLA